MTRLLLPCTIIICIKLNWSAIKWKAPCSLTATMCCKTLFLQALQYAAHYRFRQLWHELCTGRPNARLTMQKWKFMRWKNANTQTHPERMHQPPPPKGSKNMALGRIDSYPIVVVIARISHMCSVHHHPACPPRSGPEVNRLDVCQRIEWIALAQSPKMMPVRLSQHPFFHPCSQPRFGIVFPHSQRALPRTFLLQNVKSIGKVPWPCVCVATSLREHGTFMLRTCHPEELVWVGIRSHAHACASECVSLLAKPCHVTLPKGAREECIEGRAMMSKAR